MSVHSKFRSVLLENSQECSTSSTHLVSGFQASALPLLASESLKAKAELLPARTTCGGDMHALAVL